MSPKKKTHPDQLSFSFEQSMVPSQSNHTDVSNVLSPIEPAQNSNRNEFEKRLSRHTKHDWRIIWTDNLHTMISYRPDKSPPIIRLHKMFGEAPDALLADIARVIEGRKLRWPSSISIYISEHAEAIRLVEKPEKDTLDSAGSIIDLRPLFDRLNELYFDRELQVRLGWMVARKRKRSIKLGSYSEATNTIRLHPALDRRLIPRYVVEAVLFHEMVHAKLKARRKNGRRVSHDALFRQWMSRFPESEKADLWIQRNIGSLIRSRKGRKKPR